MARSELSSLCEVFGQVQDLRDPRGKRHPLPALLSLVFLGLLARIREMAVLRRWAEAHWDELKEPLGFTRDERPHATTISRALASCSLAEFSRAFLHWVQRALPDGAPLTVAVDAKTSRQGLDAGSSRSRGRKLKDRWWDEARHWTRRPGVAEWLTQLTTAAVIVLRRLGPPGLPLRGRADQFAWKPRFGFQLLGLA